MNTYEKMVFISMTVFIMVYGSDQKRVTFKEQSNKEQSKISPAIMRVRETDKRRRTTPDLLKIVGSSGRGSGVPIPGGQSNKTKLPKNASIKNTPAKTLPEQNKTEKS